MLVTWTVNVNEELHPARPGVGDNCILEGYWE